MKDFLKAFVAIMVLGYALGFIICWLINAP